MNIAFNTQERTCQFAVIRAYIAIARRWIVLQFACAVLVVLVPTPAAATADTAITVQSVSTPATSPATTATYASSITLPVSTASKQTVSTTRDSPTTATSSTRARTHSALAEHGLSIVVSGVADKATSEYITKITLEVLQSLPEGFSNGLFRREKLAIRVRSLNSSLESIDFCQSNDKTFGRYNKRRRRIEISQRLVALAQSEQALTAGSFDCQHQSIAATLKATLVHELAHVYDRKHNASESENFVALTGGETRYHRFRKNKVRNFNYAASPDPYEFKNIREAFATNFEYYQVDPDYSCARPAYTKFFDSIFQVDEDRTCTDSKQVLLHSHITTDNLLRAASLSADSVYAVHYLLASRGSSVASRWGHGMFRIITCAPQRSEVGPDCMNDSAYHLVLSYRANVADVTINYAKGLIGSYPSQLFIYQMPEIIKEYTRVEFRDLISIPLELSPKQLQQFLDVALERFWSYEGKYYFVTNHCGTEALNHLRTLNNASLRGVSSLTPRRLLKSLSRTPMADRDLLKSITSSDEPSPYFFPSKEKQYEEAFSEIRQLGIVANKSLSDFLKNSSVIDRREAYDGFFADRLESDSTNEITSRTLGSALLLERLLQTHEQARIGEDIVRLLMKDNAILVDSLRSKIKDFFKTPWTQVDDSRYGVPDGVAIGSYLAENAERRQQGTELYDVLRAYPPIAEKLLLLDELTALEKTLQQQLIRSL